MTNLWLYLITLTAYFISWLIIYERGKKQEKYFQEKYFNYYVKAFFLFAFLCMPFNFGDEGVFTVIGNATNPKGDVYSVASLYQDAERDAFNVFGIFGYQKAGDDAFTLIGISGYQQAKNEATLIAGLSIYQYAEKKSIIGMGIATYQVSKSQTTNYYAMSFIQRIALENRESIIRTFGIYSRLERSPEKTAEKLE